MRKSFFKLDDSKKYECVNKTFIRKEKDIKSKPVKNVYVGDTLRVTQVQDNWAKCKKGWFQIKSEKRIFFIDTDTFHNGKECERCFSKPQVNCLKCKRSFCKDCCNTNKHL